jgi:chemotaxis protein CheD
MEHLFLLPGKYRISKQPEVVETLVGSCVTVCLFNIKTGYAAMNHFLRDHSSRQDEDDIGKYGTTATEYIVNTLMDLDPAANHYRAQIFGGAAVLKTNNSFESIGTMNSDIARMILTKHRIRIIRQEIGGTRGRRVRFDTSTNTVFCRFAGQISKQ